MHPATFVEAAAAAMTVLFTAAGCVYAFGRREGKFSSALAENARATQRLSEVLDRLAEKFDDHETRITVTETKLKIR